MAVRGGSVASIIRLGGAVHGPLIPMGKGDILIGMEPAEALRNITYLSESSLVILNTRKVVPFTVTLGTSGYPGLGEIIDWLKGIAQKVITLDAVQIAEEAGSSLAVNIIMLGALFGTGQLPIKIETIKETIQDHFSIKLASVNVRAFDLGYKKCQQALK